MFSPVYSPDGRRVAVQWNRPNRGIWVIDMETGRQTLVYGTPLSMTPIGWSADATAIYALEAKPSRYRGVLLPIGETSTEASIVRVTLDSGRVETVAAVPFEEIGTVAMTRDAGRFIVSVYSSRSDVWVVDDFDTAPRLASRVPAP
jgi:Tol biopolymer transport system component